MDLSTNFKIMAHYNQRMNQQLLKVCEQLSPQELHQKTDAFFPTVMAHWNHILFADLIMLQRLVANKLVRVDQTRLDTLPVSHSINDTFVSTLPELKVLRAEVDQIYVQITNGFDAESCQRLVQYVTTEGKGMEKTLGEFCQHIFNHQTHHRGQLTCLLSQFGLDFGCTDLPVIVPEGAKVSLT